MSAFDFSIDQRVAQLAGLWRRSLLRWGDGRRDTTSSVRWLQGACAFADLRQPASPAPLAETRASAVRCLADLSRADCAQLARQEGFAGRLLFDGSWYEWQRWIDFQPRSAHADAGSLRQQGEVLIEQGRDLAYTEHWHRQPGGETVPRVALLLRERGTGVLALLLRVGAAFMFARERAAALPAGTTLAACVAAATSLQQAQACIDCEISFGRVEAGAFRISACTLPFRIGELLDPQLLADGLATSDRTAAGAAMRRSWTLLACEGAPSELVQLLHAGTDARGNRLTGAALD